VVQFTWSERYATFYFGNIACSGEILKVSVHYFVVSVLKTVFSEIYIKSLVNKSAKLRSYCFRIYWCIFPCFARGVGWGVVL